MEKLKKENLIEDATDSSNREQKVGFKIGSAQAQQLVYGPSTFAYHIDHDVPIGKHEGNFENAPKLTYITYETAQFLAANTYHIILNSITSITDEVAEALSHAKSRIELMRLASLSDTAVEHLSNVRRELYLGMVSLSGSVAERLSNYKGSELTFDNLRTLSDTATMCLGRHDGPLRLRNFEFKLSDTAASPLAYHKGKLEFHFSLQNTMNEMIAKYKK